MSRNIERASIQKTRKKMKKIFYTFMAMAAAFSIAGCAKELEEQEQTPGTSSEEESGYIVLGASLSDQDDQSVDTRTAIADNGNKTYSITWSDGDNICVNDEVSKPADIDPNNAKNASFTLSASIETPYCAVYPAGAYIEKTYSHSEDKDSLNIKVPSTQKYVANGIDPKSAIMLAYSTDGNLKFRHAMSYLKLTVNGADVKSVRINGNYNEAISGEFTAKLEASGTTLAFAPKKDEKGNVKGNTSITYSAETAIPAGTPMFISIPHSVYSKGLTLTIVDSEGHCQVIKSTTGFTASAGKVYPTSVNFNSKEMYVEGGIYTVEDWNNFIQDLNAGDYTKWVKPIGSETGIHIMADIECQTNLVAGSADDKATLNHILYGHGHTIKHNPVRPMFTYIGKDGGIFNLTIAGECTKWDNTGWAGIFATNNAGTLSNCVNRVNITLGKASDKATIILAAGICRTNSSIGKVMDCENYGSISITGPDKTVRVGGILVYNDGGTFASCRNLGRIEVNEVNVGCVVGGVAYASSGAVDALENSGDISIDAQMTARRTIYLGGVLANAEYGTGGNVKCSKLANCTNSGDLSIKKSGKYFIQYGAIGGVVAAVNKGAVGTEGDTFTGITSCSNTGRISFEESETEGTSIGYAFGGIVGRCAYFSANSFHYGDGGYYMIMRNGNNTGDISVSAANGQTHAFSNSGARQTYIGGLAGFICGASSNKAIVRGTSNCTITTASTLGGDIAGGLVGGGAMLSIDTKPTATTTFKAYTDATAGFWGAALGWETSKGNVQIVGADVTAVYEGTPVASGFAGVTGNDTSKATLTLSDCKYNGNAVTAADIYGNGNKSIK